MRPRARHCSLRAPGVVNEPSLFRGLYERYLQNSLREHFECAEVPIQIVFRKRVRDVIEK